MIGAVRRTGKPEVEGGDAIDHPVVTEERAVAVAAVGAHRGASVAVAEELCERLGPCIRRTAPDEQAGVPVVDGFGDPPDVRHATTGSRARIASITVIGKLSDRELNANTWARARSSATSWR